MAPRPLFALASLVLIAGAILLTFLTLLGGASDESPTNRFYFLQADTSGIAGAASLTRWTFWNACSVVNGRNDCPKVHPAYPFDPPRNFDGPDDGIPPQFIGGHKYYYLTRFMFAFILIGLFFAVCSLFLGLLALCSRIGSFLSSALCSVALFFQAITASLMTAVFILGRRNFRSIGKSADLGKYNFGFMWAATACLLLATVLFCVGGATSGRKSTSHTTTTTPRRGSRFAFGRKKHARNRGSFIDSESQRRVKEEY
ncbi:hypothetical protein MMC22_003203 [Lobaria immixta]|nr:hypothetical protein [Lobaria immixta]